MIILLRLNDYWASCKNQFTSIDFFIKNDSFVSEIIIAIKMQEQHKPKAGVNFSSMSIIERKMLNTDSREKIRAAVAGGVFFCPTA